MRFSTSKTSRSVVSDRLEPISLILGHIFLNFWDFHKKTSKDMINILSFYILIFLCELSVAKWFISFLLLHFIKAVRLTDNRQMQMKISKANFLRLRWTPAWFQFPWNLKKIQRSRDFAKPRAFDWGLMIWELEKERIRELVWKSASHPHSHGCWLSESAPSRSEVTVLFKLCAQ